MTLLILFWVDFFVFFLLRSEGRGGHATPIGDLGLSLLGEKVQNTELPGTLNCYFLWKQNRHTQTDTHPSWFFNKTTQTQTLPLPTLVFITNVIWHCFRTFFPQFSFRKQSQILSHNDQYILYILRHKEINYKINLK